MTGLIVSAKRSCWIQSQQWTLSIHVSSSLISCYRTQMSLECNPPWTFRWWVLVLVLSDRRSNGLISSPVLAWRSTAFGIPTPRWSQSSRLFLFKRKIDCEIELQHFHVFLFPLLAYQTWLACNSWYLCVRCTRLALREDQRTSQTTRMIISCFLLPCTREGLARSSFWDIGMLHRPNHHHQYQRVYFNWRIAINDRQLKLP